METEQERLWFVGVDWGSQIHQVHLADAQDGERGETQLFVKEVNVDN